MFFHFTMIVHQYHYIFITLNNNEFVQPWRVGKMFIINKIMITQMKIKIKVRNSFKIKKKKKEKKQKKKKKK